MRQDRVNVSLTAAAANMVGVVDLSSGSRPYSIDIATPLAALASIANTAGGVVLSSGSRPYSIDIATPLAVEAPTLSAHGNYSADNERTQSFSSNNGQEDEVDDEGAQVLDDHDQTVRPTNNGHPLGIFTNSGFHFLTASERRHRYTACRLPWYAEYHPWMNQHRESKFRYALFDTTGINHGIDAPTFDAREFLVDLFLQWRYYRSRHFIANVASLTQAWNSFVDKLNTEPDKFFSAFKRTRDVFYKHMPGMLIHIHERCFELGYSCGVDRRLKCPMCYDGQATLDLHDKTIHEELRLFIVSNNAAAHHQRKAQQVSAYRQLPDSDALLLRSQALPKSEQSSSCHADHSIEYIQKDVSQLQERCSMTDYRFIEQTAKYENISRQVGNLYQLYLDMSKSVQQSNEKSQRIPYCEMAVTNGDTILAMQHEIDQLKQDLLQLRGRVGFIEFNASK